jgi:rod shape-determining protein MreC
VTGGQATVTLITDSDSNVSAMVEPDGARAILKPDVGNPERMRLTYVKSTKIKKGQMVITSGSTSDRYESFFPKGIPIGKVTRADIDEIESKGEVQVQPFVNVRQLDFVSVVRAKPKTVATEQAPNGIAGGGAPTP